MLFRFMAILRSIKDICEASTASTATTAAPTSPTRTWAVNRVVICLITRNGWTSALLSFLLLFSIRLNAMKCEGLIFFVIFFLCLPLMKCICHKSVNTGNNLRLRLRTAWTPNSLSKLHLRALFSSIPNSQWCACVCVLVNARKTPKPIAKPIKV